MRSAHKLHKMGVYLLVSMSEVVLGGVIVIVLAIGPKVCGFKPG
jgi:hypothetical protein